MKLPLSNKKQAIPNFYLLKGKWGYFQAVLLIFSFFLTIIVLNGCNRPAKKNYEPVFKTAAVQKKTLIFGVPGVIFYEEQRKLVNYLNARLAPSVQIKCVAYKSIDDYLKELNAGKFDFTALNGLAAIENSQKGYEIIAKFDSDSGYYGAIFVNKDSGINHIADLKGKTMSLVGRSALGGTMMPLMYLHKHGVDVNKDLQFHYAPSFESAILDVYLGKSSGGAALAGSWRKFAKKRPEILKKITVKWVTPPLPDIAWIANNRLDRKTRSKLLELLLTMHLNSAGIAALKDGGARKIVAANNSSYESTKAFYKVYKSMIH